MITESTSQEIVTGNSAACNAGGLTAENHYWRAFNMNTFTGGADYLVTSVEFGIEQAISGTGTGQPATVNLYANHGAPFPGGDWQWIQLDRYDGAAQRAGSDKLDIQRGIGGNTARFGAGVRDGSIHSEWRSSGQQLLYRFQYRSRNGVELYQLG